MKIAISGKGGVGKTLLAAHLIKLFAESNFTVLAVDADPDANLAATLGFPDADRIIPISEMKELVEERTGLGGGYFKLNPKVDDIPEKYAAKHDGIRLMRMGRVKKGGSGCYCAENTLLRSLIAHLLIARNEVVIMDMAAGIEHLNRGTASAVDQLIIVVEPGRRSIETASEIEKLSTDLGIMKISIVGNKIHNDEDISYLQSRLPQNKLLGFIHYDQAIIEAEQKGRSVLDASPLVSHDVRKIFTILTENSEIPKNNG